MEGLTAELKKLGFIETDADGDIVSYWSVDPAEGWTAQNAQGRKYADDFAEHCRRWGPGPVLSRIQQAQAEKGSAEDSGVREGFWQQMSHLLWQGLRS